MASFIAKDKTVPPLPATDDDDESVIGGEPTVDADEVITEEQMPCTVVITGLPKTNAEETTAALSEKFMGVGTVQHTIFQMDGDQQHAVVVLDTADAATAACAMSGSQILGCDVNIIRAQQLNDDSGKNGGGENSSKMFKQAKVATVGVTASALVLGGQAVDGIKSLDERAGISKTVGAAVTTTTAKVNELDQSLGVSVAVKKTAASVTEGVKGIDQKYDISGRTTRAASDASKAASDLANKALENKHVAKGWGFMRGIGKSVLSAANTLAAEVNDTTKQATEEARKRRGVSGEETAVGGEGGQEGESKVGVEVSNVVEDPSATV